MNQQSGNGILEEFRIDFGECWQRFPNKLFFFCLLAAWLALFQFLGNSTLGYVASRSLMMWMYKAYNPDLPDPEHNPGLGDPHGNFVPFVVLGLFWWKRKELMAIEMRTWWPGLLIMATGLFFHLVGYVIQQPRISLVGMLTGLYGLTGLAWGPVWLVRSFFPFALLAFAVPLGSLADPITFRLRLLVSYLVQLVSNYALAIDVARQGTALIDPTGQYQYEVAAPCSGIRSLIVTLGLGVILGFTSLSGWWKRLALIAAGFPLAVLGNLTRMLLIIMAAEVWGRDAGNYVHEGGPLGVFSLIPYAAAFVGLFVLERYLRRTKISAPDSPGKSALAPAVAEMPCPTATQAEAEPR